jgi:glycosyltransferase involved in cell wall biosynthesis
MRVAIDANPAEDGDVTAEWYSESLSRLISMNIYALTSSRNAPASRFRIRQHIEPLRNLGVNVTEYCPRVGQFMPMPAQLARVRLRYLAPVSMLWAAGHALARTPAIVASRRAHAVWIERTIVPGLDEVVHLLARPRILDIDDAIWLEGVTGRSAATLARGVDAVIAGNQYLAEWASQYCDSIHVVPTAVDCGQFRGTPCSQDRGERFVIGWTGSTPTLKYLESIQAALAAVLRRIPGASLLVIADTRPRMPALEGLPVRYVPWSPHTEIQAIYDMDVGLMPLPDNDYTRGKCSFKLLQYMAAGLPVVASPVGMNRDLLDTAEIGAAASTASEWIDALMTLHADQALRCRMGRSGRALVEKEFDVHVVSKALASVFAMFA